MVLLTRGFKTAFVETNNSSFDKKIKTFYWGKNTQKLNLSKSYDAVILINGVSPPNYLNEKNNACIKLQATSALDAYNGNIKR